MKKILLIISLILYSTLINSQNLTVTQLTSPTNKAYVKPGMIPGFHDFNGGTFYGYEGKFDETGNMIEKTSFCLNTQDIALKEGYLEFDKMNNTQINQSFNYINYQTGESKPVDIFKITGSDKKDMVCILRQQTVRDRFVVYNGKKFFVIKEDLTIEKEFDAKYSYVSYNLFEVFSDGCVYYLNRDKNVLTVRKVDLQTSNEYELQLTPSNGLEIIPTSWYIFSFLEAGQYRLSLNNDGTKAFLGFFPGKLIYDQNMGAYSNVSTNARFIIIDNTKFTVEFDKMIDISDDYIMETRENAKNIDNPFIEDVEFLGDEILVSTSCMTNYGVNPIAVYRIIPSQKKIELDGIITNKFDDVLTRDRQSSQMFTVGNKTYLVYFTFMSDDKAFKAINKTYPTFHVIDLTKGNYNQKMFKEEVASLEKSKIYTYNYQTIDKNTIMFLASTIGVSVYENLFAVKIVFE